MGEKINTLIQIQENGQTKPAGGIYLTEQILIELQQIIGKDRVKLMET